MILNNETKISRNSNNNSNNYHRFVSSSTSGSAEIA